MNDDVRLLAPDEIPAAGFLTHAAFYALEHEWDEAAARADYTEQAWNELRLVVALETDPGGVVVAGPPEAPTGLSITLRRGGLWILSLLVVHPTAQGTGVGRALLGATAHTRGDATALAVSASRAPAAARTYLRLGMDMHPSFKAVGKVRRLDAPAPDVRDGEWTADAAHVSDVVLAQRGFPNGPDLPSIAGREDGLLVSPTGFVTWSAKRNVVTQCVAATPTEARALLHTCFARLDPERDVEVLWLTGNQQWAMHACVDAGMALAGAGAVGWAGLWGPAPAYLPSGAYL